MHELGLVNYVVKQVTKIAEENHVEKLHSVTLEFGEVSGIVPSYLYSYWDWYTKKFPLFNGTKLLCETIPAVTWCDDCRKTYPTVQCKFDAIHLVRSMGDEYSKMIPAEDKFKAIGAYAAKRSVRILRKKASKSADHA